MRTIIYVIAGTIVVSSASLENRGQAASISTPVVQTQQQQDAIGGAKLNLTMEQRYTIKEIVKGLKVEKDRSNALVAVGKVVPKSIHMQPMPVEIAAKVSPIKSHLFFLKGDKVVIVDPKDNRVVEVID
jgi:hypothetical protein